MQFVPTQTDHELKIEKSEEEEKLKMMLTVPLYYKY